MTILVAPLNWGLGHASRCVPLVRQLVDEGNEVILGGDGESLTLLRKHFPTLRYVYLAPLHLTYSRGKSQVWAMCKALPQLIAWSIKDHAILQSVLQEEPIDRVISDNRFGLYHSQTECIYMTHQLHILLPKGWRWLEPIAERLHARIYKRFKEVWVPDYEDPSHSLAGELSHIKVQRDNGQCTKGQCTMYNGQRTMDNVQRDIRYIGPQSRFTSYKDVCKANEMQTVVAVLSGLEPQRTMLEREIVRRYTGSEEQVMIVQGLMNRPNTRIKRGNITLVPYMTDRELATALLHAKHIIARSGYSTIMDLEALGVMNKSELIPTPGQPEQEYLAFLHCKK